MYGDLIIQFKKKGTENYINCLVDNFFWNFFFFAKQETVVMAGLTKQWICHC